MTALMFLLAVAVFIVLVVALRTLDWEEVRTARTMRAVMTARASDAWSAAMYESRSKIRLAEAERAAKRAIDAHRASRP